MIDREDVQILSQLTLWLILGAVAVVFVAAALGIAWVAFETTRGLT